MKRTLVIVLCTCFWLPTWFSLQAAAGRGYTMPLFNGENLDGWNVTGCEAIVKDGTILLQSGNGLVRTDHRYADFVLELEWKALKADKWDSGIYFRSELPPKGRPWPSRYQANLRKGMEGNVGELKGARSRGLTRPGEWNRFKLTVEGTAAALEINGKPAWKADGLESASGHIALQAEIPGGGRFLFRNIHITELGHEALFDGKSLKGWEGATGEAEACWEVKDGTLVCTGKRGPWLRSLKQYADFNLRLEYRLKPAGNSGVFVRVAKRGAHRRAGDGIEVQILDDNHKKYADIAPYQFCGSLYGIAPARHHVSRPAGRWNTLEIDCRGSSYRITHNGAVIVDATAEALPKLSERRKRGFVGLQNHSEEVHFRHLRVESSGD